MKFLMLFLCACSSRTIGDLRVSLDDGVRVSRAGTTLLTSADGRARSEDPSRPGAAYAAFAGAKVSVESEEAFGAFRFSDGVRPYAALELRDVHATASGVAFSFASGGEGSVQIENGSVVIDWRAKGVSRVAMSFTCEEAERFFGLGAQISFEHTGRRVPIWVSEQGLGKLAYGETRSGILGTVGAHYDSYAPIPFTVTSAHRGLWLDESARAELELCERDGMLRIEADGSHFRLRVFFAATMREVVTQFASASGTPPVLPLWAFSPWVDVFGGPQAIRDAAAFVARQRNTGIGGLGRGLGRDGEYALWREPLL